MNNSVIENTHTAGANAAGSALLGTNLTINNWTATDDTSSKPFAIGSSSSVRVTGYQATNSLTTSSVAGGSTLNYDSSLGTGLGFADTSSIFWGQKTVTISATATPTALPGSSANSGLLRLRDNTSGGGALFLIDPNGGSQLIGISQITGLASAAGITFSGGVWNVTLSSGTTPRTLVWTIYD